MTSRSVVVGWCRAGREVSMDERSIRVPKVPPAGRGPARRSARCGARPVHRAGVRRDPRRGHRQARRAEQGRGLSLLPVQGGDPRGAGAARHRADRHPGAGRSSRATRAIRGSVITMVLKMLAGADQRSADRRHPQADLPRGAWAFPSWRRCTAREVLDKVMPVIEGLIRNGVDQGYLRQVDPDLTIRSHRRPAAAARRAGRDLRDHARGRPRASTG